MFQFFKKKEKAKLFYHTDIHSHILPGVDHGAQDIDAAIRLIAAQKEMGIDRIILTPHVTQTAFENNPATIEAAYNTFSQEIKARNIDTSFAYSAEYRIDELFLSQFKNNELIAMPDNYLLVENAFSQEFLGLEQLLFEIQIKGFSPIMAHPERYRYYRAKSSRYTQLHDAGIRFQVNLLSFAGHYGESERETALWLLSQGYIDFLGSDIHNDEHASIISNYIQTKDYAKIAAKLDGRILNDSIF